MLITDSSRSNAITIPWGQISHTAPDNTGSHSLVRTYLFAEIDWSAGTGVMTITANNAGDFADVRTGQLIRFAQDGSFTGNAGEQLNTVAASNFSVTKVDDSTLTVELTPSTLAQLQGLNAFGSYSPGSSATWFSFDATPQRALVVAADANAGNIAIGPNSNANAKTLQPGETYLIEMPAGYKFDLSQWYYKAATANDKLIVLYV